MKTVHVFLWCHRLQQSLRIHLRGKRQLQQNSVNVLTLVQGGDQRQHLFRSHRIGWRNQVAGKPQLGAGFHLAANIDLRGGDISNEHSRQPWTNTLFSQPSDLGGNFAFDLRCNRCAVEHTGLPV